MRRINQVTLLWITIDRFRTHDRLWANNQCDNNKKIQWKVEKTFLQKFGFQLFRGNKTFFCSNLWICKLWQTFVLRFSKAKCHLLFQTDIQISDIKDLWVLEQKFYSVVVLCAQNLFKNCVKQISKKLSPYFKPNFTSSLSESLFTHTTTFLYLQ